MISYILFFSMFSFINKFEEKPLFDNYKVEKEYNILEDEILKQSNIHFGEAIKKEKEEDIIIEKNYKIKETETINEIKLNEVENLDFSISENTVSLEKIKIDCAVEIYMDGWLNQNYPFESPDEILEDFGIPMTKDNYNYTVSKIIERSEKFGCDAEVRDLYSNCHIL